MLLTRSPVSMVQAVEVVAVGLSAVLRLRHGHRLWIRFGYLDPLAVASAAAVAVRVRGRRWKRRIGWRSRWLRRNCCHC